MVDGRALTVRVRSEAPSGPRRGLGAPRPDEELPPECKLYVGSLPHTVDEHALTREFARFGPVVRCEDTRFLLLGRGSLAALMY